MWRSGPALRFKVVRPAVAVAGLLLSGVAFAPYAQARVSCSYSGPPANVLTVRTGTFDAAEVTRNGSEIVVRQVLGQTLTCAGGTPTVLNTDTIRAPAENLDFLLDGGPFAPGATPETEGVPEIEIRVSGPEAQVTIVGTSGEDHFHWGAGGAHAGLNLNPGSGGDEDVDVTVVGIGAFLVADGAAGNDTIIPAPGGVDRGDGILSIGGGGDDLLSAATTYGLLDGGAGADRLIAGSLGAELRGGGGSDRIDGGDGHDLIAGGRGRDLVFGGRGRDRINSRDTRRDRVSCGPGRDRVKADRKDRLRGCELTSRR